MILIALVAAISSCSSPADVPANRRVIVDSVRGRGELEPSRRLIDFGTVIRNTGDESAELTVSIHNRLTFPETITSIELRDNRPEFTVSHPALPVTLAGGGSVTILIRFRPRTDSLIVERLIVNDSIEIDLRADATSFAIRATDIDFGASAFGVMRDSVIYVINDSPARARITGAAIKGFDATSFGMLPPFHIPDTLEPGERLGFGVRFMANQATISTAVIEFTIAATAGVQIDSLAVMTGRTAP